MQELFACSVFVGEFYALLQTLPCIWRRQHAKQKMTFSVFEFHPKKKLLGKCVLHLQSLIGSRVTSRQGNNFCMPGGVLIDNPGKESWLHSVRTKCQVEKSNWSKILVKREAQSSLHGAPTLIFTFKTARKATFVLKTVWLHGSGF